jgi:hypothetical protein
MAVGRFQVMTVLQSARAHVLGLPLESAHSWGLNRAIFIAAAKRGFKGGGGKGGKETGLKKSSKGSNEYFLGDDMAYRARGDPLLFTFGGKVQTEEEFDKRVKARFGRSYERAWKEALAYVKTFDRETLLSAEGFYRDVYKPRRDELAEAWTEAATTPS